MKELLLKHIITVIFGGISSILTFLYVKLHKEVNSYKSMQNALKALLRDRLYQGSKHFLQLQYISTHELENLTDLYTEYKALGGNGVVEEIYLRVKKLEIKDEF